MFFEKNTSAAKAAMLSLCVLFLTACGGGGGGGGGGGSPTPNPNPSPPAKQPFSFQAPAITVSQGASVNSGDQVDLFVNLNNPEPKPVQYEIIQLTSGAQASLPAPSMSNLLSFVAPTLAGTQTLSFRVTVRELNSSNPQVESTDFSLTVIGDQPPVISYIGSQVPELYYTGGTYRLEARFEDPEGEALTVSFRQVSGPVNVAFTTSTFNLPAQQGPQIQLADFTVPVSNVGGAIDFELSVSDGVNPPVTLTFGSSIIPLLISNVDTAGKPIFSKVARQEIRIEGFTRANGLGDPLVYDDFANTVLYEYKIFVREQAQPGNVQVGYFKGIFNPNTFTNNVPERMFIELPKLDNPGAYDLIVEAHPKNSSTVLARAQTSITVVSPTDAFVFYSEDNGNLSNDGKVRYFRIDAITGLPSQDQRVPSSTGHRTIKILPGQNPGEFWELRQFNNGNVQVAYGSVLQPNDPMRIRDLATLSSGDDLSVSRDGTKAIIRYSGISTPSRIAIVSNVIDQASGQLTDLGVIPLDRPGKVVSTDVLPMMVESLQFAGDDLREWVILVSYTTANIYFVPIENGNGADYFGFDLDFVPQATDCVRSSGGRLTVACAGLDASDSREKVQIVNIGVNQDASILQSSIITPSILGGDKDVVAIVLGYDAATQLVHFAKFELGLTGYVIDEILSSSVVRSYPNNGIFNEVVKISGFGFFAVRSTSNNTVAGLQIVDFDPANGFTPRDVDVTERTGRNLAASRDALVFMGYNSTLGADTAYVFKPSLNVETPAHQLNLPSAVNLKSIIGQ